MFVLVVQETFDVLKRCASTEGHGATNMQFMHLHAVPFIAITYN